MKTIIVLAMHGAPPNDLPRDEAVEFFALHARLEHTHPSERAGLEQRFAALEQKMRDWPRNALNDPFYTSSYELAQHLAQQTGLAVMVGFNEFCAPSLDKALDQAVAADAERVIVVTPMLTRGGEHAERDIPAALVRARQRHPAARIEYAWPFDVADTARFLGVRINLLVAADTNGKDAACTTRLDRDMPGGHSGSIS